MKIIIFPLLAFLERSRKNFFEKKLLSFSLFLPFLMPFYEWLGKWKAYKVFCYSKKSVPGYKKFFKKSGVEISSIEDFGSIPISSKKNYVKKYSIEERCVDGEIPAHGVIVDESSGTSGVPTNWVRGYDERKSVKKMLQIAFQNHFGDEKMIAINAFALGVRATGINVSISLVDIAILKSTGPDKEKIIKTLEFFGPTYKYVIMGYPPFLKSLVDTSSIDWNDYDISVVFGGEGISEELRSYLMKYFTTMYGSYGASDLEINMAAESDFSIALRKEIIANEGLADELIRTDYGVVPIIFQYHPLDYYIETNNDGELVVTINRITNISPRVRYNIQDLGHIVSMRALKKLLDKHAVDYSSRPKTANLPFLFHYGRSTGTIAYYGSKLSPNDMHEVVVGMENLTKSVNSFAFDLHEDEEHNKILVIKVELYEGIENIGFEDYEKTILENLMRVNQDFKEAYSYVPEKIKPTVQFYAYKTDSFSLENDNVKKRYFVE